MNRIGENIGPGKLSVCHKAVLEAVGGIWRTIFKDGERREEKKKAH